MTEGPSYFTELSGAGRPLVRVALDEEEDADDDPERPVVPNPYRPIIVFTSNSEKALPDPFLRRCVYHHLDFPPFAAEIEERRGRVTVESIVLARLGGRCRGNDETSRRVADAVGFFRHLRQEQTGLERRPTLAESLDWLNYLMPKACPVAQWRALAALGTPGDPASDAALANAIKGLLLKKPGDQARIGELLADWRKTRR